MLDLDQIKSFYPESLRPFERYLLREYLQYKILGIIFDSGFSGKLAFMGGTAIHILHGNTRFSEELDFDNLGIDKSGFAELNTIIQNRLTLEGYHTEVTTSFEGAYRAFIKIADVLYENKLSSHREEKLLIQFDTEPQSYKYACDSVIINKFDVFTRINAVPLGMLLAQKIYAIFMRKRPMGRDFYDAIFLLGKTKPDIGYLDAKLGISDIGKMKEKLLERCGKLDFRQLARDVEPFLYIPAEAKKVLLFTEYVNSI